MPIAEPAFMRLHQRQLDSGLIKSDEDCRNYRTLIPEGQPIPHKRSPWNLVTESEKRRLKRDAELGIPQFTAPPTDGSI